MAVGMCNNEIGQHLKEISQTDGRMDRRTHRVN